MGTAHEAWPKRSARAVGLPVCVAGLAGAMTCSPTGQALAQNNRWDYAKLYGATAVHDRSQSEYQPQGLRIGNYLLFPEVGFGTSWTGDGLADKNGDFRYEVSTGLRLMSQLPRHFFGLRVAANAVQYQRNSDLKYINGAIQAQWRIDLDHATKIVGSAGSALVHDEGIDAERPKGTSTPPTFYKSSAELAWRRDTGRIDASVGLRYSRVDYNDATANDGSRIELSWQNYSTLAPYVRLGMNVSPGYRVSGEVSGLAVENEGNGEIDRDARGGRVTVGTQFEITPLLRASVSAGWVVQDYLQEGLVDISAPVWEANLEWLASPLVTIGIGARRDVRPTSFGSASGAIITTFGVKAEYEMWRNLRINAGASIGEVEYVGDPRSDTIWRAGAGLNYLINRNWVAGASYEHQELISSGEENNRRQDKIGVSVGYRY